MIQRMLEGAPGSDADGWGGAAEQAEPDKMTMTRT
jgi:hypothetical protein